MVKIRRAQSGNLQILAFNILGQFGRINPGQGSVTVASLIEGVPLSGTVVGVVPPDGVFFTVKALLASEAAAARFSSKVSTSEAPFTEALETMSRIKHDLIG